MLLSVLEGFRRGFILGLLDLLRWAASLLAGLRFYQPVARFIGERVDLWSEVWDQPIAFLLVATAAGVFVHLLGYSLLRRMPTDVHERRVNRLFGTLPGLANGLILAAIVAALLLAVPLHESLRERARQSALVNRFAVCTERVEMALAPIFNDAITRTLNRLTITDNPRFIWG